MHVGIEYNWINMQREEDGDYEDREGENMYAEAEDPYITDKQYKCDNCGAKKMEKHGVLFAPFHCNRPMKLLHKLEHKFDFETITKRSIEKERLMFPTGKGKGKSQRAKIRKKKQTKSAKRKTTKKSKHRPKQKRRK